MLRGIDLVKGISLTPQTKTQIKICGVKIHLFFRNRLTNLTPRIIIKSGICGVNMSIESNIGYLDYEINSNKERLALMEKYLLTNPAQSIYRRKIDRNTYYYKKFRKDGKSVSQYLGNNPDQLAEIIKEIEAKNQERQQVKKKYKKIKEITAALEKQLKIAGKVYLNE
jgi:hypothetical protein